MSETRGPWDILTGNVEHDRRNVEIVLASVEQLYSPRDTLEVIRHALDRAIEVTGAQRGIFLLESDGDADGDGSAELGIRTVRSADGKDLDLDQRYSRSVVKRVWESNNAEIMIDAEDQSEAALGQSILDLRLLSIMATPLTAKDNRIGVLYVDSTVQAKEFTKADLAVFKALGGMAAIAIENGRLLEERAAKERMARDLAVAREIQQGLFPKDIPSPEGFDLAAVGRPCDETSGDYYDVIPLDGGRLALVVGDVSGHGLGAALFMTQARALIHALLRADPDLGRVVSGLNDFLERDMPASAFLTLFVGVLDPATRTLTYVNAGHNAPVHIRGADGAVEAYPATGPLLGVIPDTDYIVEGPIELAAGDVLMAYTDGLFEAHDPQDEMYGEPRFRESLAAHVAKGVSSEAILDGVLEDLFAFVDGRPLDDDVTALVVRVV